MEMVQTSQVQTPASNPLNKPVGLGTPTGTVMIWGHEHVSKRMIEMIEVILSHDAFEKLVYHGIKSIVFRIDGYPKEGEKSVCANFAPDTCGIAINMVETYERAKKRSIDNPETSIMASWWLEMLLNLGHELHHAVLWNTDREVLHNNEKLLNEEETLAEEYSIHLLTTLAKEINIEPPVVTAEPWFNSQIGELLSKEDSWTLSQRNMLHNNCMWEHIPSDTSEEVICLQTFCEFVNLFADKSVPENKQLVVTKTATPDPIQQTAEKESRPLPENSSQSDEYDQYNDIYIISDTVDHSPPKQACLFPSQQLNTQPQQNVDSISRIAKQVYMKMYNHIFTNCVQQKEADVGFANPEAVCSMPIPLTDEENSMFVSMNHLDINGRWCTDVSTTKGLLGKIMKNTKLPSYEVILNVNGELHRRLFIPQNPAKRNASGQLTQRALEARAGNAIAYVMNPDDDSINKWGPSIVNGVYKTPRTP